jgi:hypothetical protein
MDMEDDVREMVEGAMLLHEGQPATSAALLETPELLLALVLFGTAICDLFYFRFIYSSSSSHLYVTLKTSILHESRRLWAVYNHAYLK